MATITLCADTDQERANDRLGLCPNCKTEPTLLQPVSDVYGACLTCKLAWYLTNEQRQEFNRDVQQAKQEQAKLLDQCVEAEPTYNRETLARLQARKEWVETEEERVQREAAQLMDHLLAGLPEEQRTAFLRDEWATSHGQPPEPSERLGDLMRFLQPTRQPFPDDVEAARFQNRSRFAEFDDDLPF
jgi:hypothetical protein